MLTRMRSWFTGAPGRISLPARADADVALTRLISEAYEAMGPVPAKAGEARRIMDQAYQLQVRLGRRECDYDVFRPEVEARMQLLRAELQRVGDGRK